TYPGHMPAAPLEPDPCQPAQPGELTWGHRLGGVSQPQGAAGLDLHDDQVVTVECDQVDLALMATPVALHPLGAGTLDPLLRQVLPGAADLVLAGHRTTSRSDPAGFGTAVRPEAVGVVDIGAFQDACPAPTHRQRTAEGALNGRRTLNPGVSRPYPRRSAPGMQMSVRQLQVRFGQLLDVHVLEGHHT